MNDVTAGNDIREKRGLISRIQASFIFRVFMSLVLSVCVWLTMNSSYVNPPGRKTFPVTLTQLHRSSLTNHNLELRNEIIKNSVTVDLKGRQEDIDAIVPSDFDAYIDFSKITGVEDKSIKVDLVSTKADNITIVKIEPSEIPIEVERRMTKTLNIDIKLNGEPADGFFLTNYSCNPPTKLFAAKESLIEQIDKVIVETDIEGIAGNMVLHKQCKVLDVTGAEMIVLGWEQLVDISLEISKDVKVVANVEGSPAYDYYVRYTTVTPETVRINGTREALENIESLDAGTVNIASSRQSVTKELTFMLPYNAKLTNSTLPRVVVDVTINKYQYTQDVSLNRERIDLINKRAEYRYEVVENEIPLLLKGKSDDIANIDPDLVSAVIDVGEFTPGRHAAKAILYLPAGIECSLNVLVTLIVAKNE